ncbi:MAG TPA: helix-turn-helix transcriptional regulator [Archangium sp.]|uniref:helix-turn-helix transcriptional regulator n=1 Tax=Archangium sp. TaxID=1872627 RepID=UPI002E32910D|nr:helix-turn-helix transcriptional regulator [Archangium sp.]HEX5751107.1 helix-turn-helix transcriptional regulator [Archangium sp.]
MSTDKKVDTKRKALASHLGDTFREARERAGFTQADVAERAGMSTEVYGRLERGLMFPSVPRMRRLCQVLREDANTVLGLTGRKAADWLQEAVDLPEDTPRMRRMVRHLRQLEDHHGEEALETNALTT